MGFVGYARVHWHGYVLADSLPPTLNLESAYRNFHERVQAARVQWATVLTGGVRCRKWAR